MTRYTVLVTVTVCADSQHEAYGYIKTALKAAKQAEIVYEDAEVTAEQPEDDDEPCLPDGTPIYKSRTLTRHERLQGLADQGIDTHREYDEAFGGDE